MQSLWKLTALAGVIGAGVMIVVEAQRNLATRNAAANEEFVTVDGSPAAPWQPSDDAKTVAAASGQSPAPAKKKAGPSDAFAFLYQDSGDAAEKDAAVPPAQVEPTIAEAAGNSFEKLLTSSSPPSQAEPQPVDVTPPADLSDEAPRSLRQMAPASLDIAATPEGGIQLASAAFPADEPTPTAEEPLRPFPKDLDAPVLLTPPSDAEQPRAPDAMPLIAKAILETAEDDAPQSDAVVPAAAEAALEETRESNPFLDSAETSSAAPVDVATDDIPINLFTKEPAAVPEQSEPAPLMAQVPRPADRTREAPVSQPSENPFSLDLPASPDRTREPVNANSFPDDRSRTEPLFADDAPNTREAVRPPDRTREPVQLPSQPQRDLPPFSTEPASSIPQFPGGPTSTQPSFPSDVPARDRTRLPEPPVNQPSFEAIRPGVTETPPLPPFPDMFPAGTPPQTMPTPPSDDGMVPIRSRHNSRPDSTPAIVPMNGERSSLPPYGQPANNNPSLPTFGNGSSIPASSPFPGTSDPATPPYPATPPFPGNNSQPGPATTPVNNGGLDYSGTGTIDPAVASGPQQPELQIQKDAPPKAELNQPLVYNIRVRNVGRIAAHNVTVEDAIPRGSNLIGTIPEAVFDAQSKRISWQLGTLEPGAESLIRVKVVPTEPGEIGSVATVRFVSRVASRTVVTAPRLTLEMQGPTESVVGETASFRFRIVNIGDGDAQNVLLKNIIPEQFHHPHGSDLEYEVGTVPAGQSRDVVLAVSAAKPGTAKNTAIVVLNEKEQARSQSDVAVIKSRLSIVRTGPERRFVGRAAKYATQITNQSGQPLRNITVLEQLAPGVEVAAVPEHGRFDPVRRTITWTIPQLAPQQSIEINTSLAAGEAGKYACAVQAFDAAGNKAEATSQLDVEGFSLLKTQFEQLSQQGGEVNVGDQIALRMTIHNRGSAAAQNVITEFEIPPELEFVAAQPQKYTMEGNMVRFEAIPFVDAGMKHTIDLVCVAKSSGTPRLSANVQSQGLPSIRQEEALVVLSTGP